ncbi:hypothetical protein KKE38_02820 [Candidatus Micrarchaeota archaeon]|nr:hypothetical protein [Candidatus Micrarchaeota archaeon]
MEFDELLITTGVDALVRLIKEKQRIELEDASSILNIPSESLEDWARVLEEEGIMRIEYRLTKIYLVWTKPTVDEIETERESFYEEKEDIQKQVETFRGKMKERKDNLTNLHSSFGEFYDKTYSKMQELEKKISPLPAGELLSVGNFAKGEQELSDMKYDLEQIKDALGGIRNEIRGVGIVEDDAKSKSGVEGLEKMNEELKSMQEEMIELRKKAEGHSKDEDPLPSSAAIKKKFESLKKEFSLLKTRNSRLREDVISLHESSQILQDVAESIMGQEEKIGSIHEDVATVSKEAEELLKKVEGITKKAKQNVELVERLGESVTVAKGILKRFPSQEKMIHELESVKESEALLDEKYNSMETLIDAVGGKQITSKQFTELGRKMDDKIETVRRDMDALETALEHEKGTYLTFQKIKERIVPSITRYEKQLDGIEERIGQIGKESVAQKESLKNDAKKLQESLKGGDVNSALKLAGEIRDKKKMLEDVKNSLDDLVTLSDNLNKRITLLSREAKLLEIRAGSDAPSGKSEDAVKRKDVIRQQLDLTKDEEREFRKKREELKKLIKRLWEE